MSFTKGGSITDSVAEPETLTLFTLGMNRPAGTELFTIVMEDGMGALPLFPDREKAEGFIQEYKPGNPLEVLPVDPPGLVRSLRYLVKQGVGYLAMDPVAVGEGTASFVPVLALEYLGWVEEAEMGTGPVV